MSIIDLLKHKKNKEFYIGCVNLRGRKIKMPNQLERTDNKSIVHVESAYIGEEELM